MSEKEEMVLYNVEDKIAYITFNRPKKLNAMDVDCLKRIGKLLDKADKDENVNVIVFKSVGRAFTAGYYIDFKNPNIDVAKTTDDILTYGTKISKGIYKSKKPTICEVQGFSIGFGMILLFAVDFRFVANDPKIYFYLPEFSLAMKCQTGPIVGPVNVIGQNKAKEMLLGDKKVTIEEFDRWGGITKICEPENLGKEVKEFAKKIAEKNSTLSYILKTSINIMNNRLVDDMFKLEVEMADYHGKNMNNPNPTDINEFMNKMWEKYGNL
ncbi:MAG: enoyl-CoA hydratase/isomerase family protein [Promethearchaeota archaeon]